MDTLHVFNVIASVQQEGNGHPSHEHLMTMCRQRHGLTRSAVAAALLRLLQKKLVNIIVMLNKTDRTALENAPVYWNAVASTVQSLNDIHSQFDRLVAGAMYKDSA